MASLSPLEAANEFLTALSAIPQAHAAAWDFNVNVCTLLNEPATCLAMPIVQKNMFTFAISAAFAICTGVLLVGCLYMVISGGRQDLLERGKDIIKYSLVGFAVIGGSFIILRAVTWLLYSG